MTGTWLNEQKWKWGFGGHQQATQMNARRELVRRAEV